MIDGHLFSTLDSQNIPATRLTHFRWIAANTVAKDREPLDALVVCVRFRCKEWDFAVTGFDRDEGRIIGFVFWRRLRTRCLYVFSVQGFPTWCRDNGFQATLDEDWEPTRLARCGEVFWR